MRLRYGYINSIVWRKRQEAALAAKWASDVATTEWVCDPAARKLPCRCWCATGPKIHVTNNTSIWSIFSILNPCQVPLFQAILPLNPFLNRNPNSPIWIRLNDLSEWCGRRLRRRLNDENMRMMRREKKRALLLLGHCQRDYLIPTSWWSAQITYKFKLLYIMLNILWFSSNQSQ